MGGLGLLCVCLVSFQLLRRGGPECFSVHPSRDDRAVVMAQAASALCGEGKGGPGRIRTHLLPSAFFQLIDLSSPLIQLSPEADKENVDSPLLKF